MTAQVIWPLCRNGHEKFPENTYKTPAGISTCRECHRDRNRESARRIRAGEQPRRRGPQPKPARVPRSRRLGGSVLAFASADERERARARAADSAYPDNPGADFASKLLA